MDRSRNPASFPINPLSPPPQHSQDSPPDPENPAVTDSQFGSVPVQDDGNQLKSSITAFDLPNYQPSAATFDWLDSWKGHDGVLDSPWAAMDASLGDGSYFLPDSSLLGAHDVFSPYPELLATPESKNPSVESMGNPLHPQSQYLSQDNNSTEGIHSTQNTEADSDFRAKSNLSMPVASHNTRAGLPRRRSRYFIRRSMPTSKPVFIPNQADEALDPMQRWQESPPEDEPASMSAIMNAINTSDKEGIKPRTRNSFRRYRGSNSRASSNSGTSISSHQSAASTRSTASAATPDPLVAQTKSHSRVNKGKRRRPADNNDQSRVFCCTFCCDKFKNRYDWVRHEKSLHLNLEEWSCAPHGGSPLSPLTNRRHCAYCHCLEPSAQHLEDHNFYPCSTGDRTFRRKDHLVQHLRLVHHLDAMPLIDDWKTTASVVTSRCGFCDQRLASWDDRIEHLAVHYRAGMKMNDWRGDHEFEPSIAARVTNAVPPYLLGSESVSLVPFSATDLTTKDHFAQISSRAHWANKGTGQQTPHQAERNAEELGLTTSFEQLQTHDTPLKTFMEVITLHLSRYARQQMSEGVIPTDEMFQREARQVMYGSEDSWEQTFADHPEWISTFRQKHCRTDDPTLAGLADSPDSSKAIQPE